MEFIHDVSQIKRLERLVKRPLTKLEVEGIHPVRWVDADGKVHEERVKKYNFKDFSKPGTNIY